MRESRPVVPFARPFPVSGRCARGRNPVFGIARRSAKQRRYRSTSRQEPDARIDETAAQKIRLLHFEDPERAKVESEAPPCWRMNASSASGSR